MNTIQSYLKSYNDYLTLRNYSDRSIRSYSSALRKFLNYSYGQDYKEIGFSEFVRQYLLHIQREGIAWSSINVHYSAIKIFSDKVLKQSWDVSHLPRPKQKKRLPRILSIEEITRLIQSPRNLKHRVIIAFLYSTGLRISEAIDIRLIDIDSVRMELFVRQGKGSKDRIVEMAPRLLNILRIYYKEYRPKQYLFEGSSVDGKYSKTSISKIISRARLESKIGKAVSAHTFRHCYATHHLEHGTDLVYLKEQLGHKNLMTTARYIHLCRQRMRQIHHPIEDLSLDICKRTL